ncbi:MAG: MauE/DoxX family redox-associated membrane protein [Solirubrobacteraceae bacterium]
MGDVLTAPLAVAALVLVVAGVAKLRAPAPAVGALRELGLPAGQPAIRVFAAAEIALGVWVLASPGGVPAIALGCCYAVFSALALLLAGRRSACGCFGEGDFPASCLQALISAVLAVTCGGAAVWPPHAILDRPAGQAVVLVIGIAASTYATVLAYTQLPAAWSAWSPR